MIINDIYLTSQEFLQEYASKEDVIKAKRKQQSTCLAVRLQISRLRKLTTKTVKRHAVDKVRSLPPTSNAAMFHSMRVYLQYQYWKGIPIVDLIPTKWDWTFKTEKLLPTPVFKCINNLQPTFCQKSATAIVKLTATIRDIAVESERMAQRIQVDVDNVNESTASIQEILQNLVMGVKTKPRFENL